MTRTQSCTQVTSVWTLLAPGLIPFNLTKTGAVQNTVQSKNIEHHLPGSKEAVLPVQLNEMQGLYSSKSSQLFLNPPNLDNC
ncbi:hypothetical protein VNO77_04766 [Canavalia gladiata]|uniref:Uncharacterized protein n=1 Tax=Canavalia gladiata TaxID=3824 RepID=A0AAN9N285_CANGL